MKNIQVLLFLLMLMSINLCAQEKMEIEGAIILSNAESDTPKKGTIRWNDTTADFEGFNGETWVSLTRNNGGWGKGTKHSKRSSKTL